MYTDFAYCYDRLMKDVDYSRWADYIEELFRLHSLKPSLVLDLGCGTGSFCLEMAGKGYDMLGIDLSADMLACAKAKSVEKGRDILFLNQDMTGFELYGTVDAIVCLIDSMNYITYKNDLKRLFKLVRNYLNPGGLFIFDINSEYKFEKVLGSNVYHRVEEDVAYIWQNSYDRSRRLCRFDLTVFVGRGHSCSRFDEVHHERAYSTAELEGLVRDSGLRLCSVLGEFSVKKPGKKCERIFFVCKK
jgi:SAM-dependent methyltransferase